MAKTQTKAEYMVTKKKKKKRELFSLIAFERFCNISSLGVRIYFISSVSDAFFFFQLSLLQVFYSISV